MKTVKLEKFKRRDLAKWFGELGFTRGVEIGVCHGTYSKVLCEENPNLHLISVDPYAQVYEDYRSRRLEEDGQYGDLYNEAKNLLVGLNCTLVRDISMNVVKKFDYRTIDFVYIDGSHEYDYVATDLIEWGRRVRKGGIIAGHDYIHNKFKCDVIRAVNAYAEGHKVKLINLTDERTPSWWFEKTW